MTKKPRHMMSSASWLTIGVSELSVLSSISCSTPSRTSGNRCRNVVHSRTPPPKFSISRSIVLAAPRARRRMPSRSNTHTGSMPAPNDDTPRNAMANIFDSTTDAGSSSALVATASTVVVSISRGIRRYYIMLY